MNEEKSKVLINLFKESKIGVDELMNYLKLHKMILI